MAEVTWTVLKTAATAKALPIQYVETEVQYYVYISDNGFVISTVLDKNPTDTTDLNDFVNNYKATANTALSQLDTDGAFIVRNKAAKKGWTFCSLPFEFQTARLSDSLYSKDSTGADRTFITLKAYDNGGTEVTTPGVLNANYANIVKTVIDFEPPYDYEVIGGDIRTLTSIVDDIRLWIVAAPDVAAPNGSKEMGGGINLRYLAPGNVWSVDGRVSKFASYNATYHTNKLRLIITYPAGVNESLQVIVQLYKA